MSEYKFISHQIQVDLERSIGEVQLNVLGEIMLASVMINNNKLQMIKWMNEWINAEHIYTVLLTKSMCHVRLKYGDFP